MKPRRRTPHESLGLERFRTPPSDEHGLALDQLTAAYAQLIARGDDPYVSLPDPDSLPSVLDDDPDTADQRNDAPGDSSGDSPADGLLGDDALAADQSSVVRSPDAARGWDDGRATADEAYEVSPRSILEAMLFVGHPENKPLNSEHVASLMRGVRAHEIDELVKELNRTYDADGSPYRIEAIGAGYQLALRDEFNALRDVFYGRVKAARLSQAAIDVLAIVAYGQPMTREDVETLRGKPSGSLLSQLVRRQLLHVERSSTRPRIQRFFTTDRFLHLFGLQSLRDLPQTPD